MNFEFHIFVTDYSSYIWRFGFLSFILMLRISMMSELIVNHIEPQCIISAR
jgi:hypothetical protein